MLELKYALRSLRRTAGSSIVSIAVLAIGIGACTAVFSVIEAVLLNPPPYPNSERISMLWIRARPDMKLGYSEWPLHGTQFNFLNAHRKGLETTLLEKPSDGTGAQDQPTRPALAGYDCHRRRQ